MSEQKNNPQQNQPEEARFQMDEDGQQATSNLNLDGNDIQSNSNGEGPMPAQAYQKPVQPTPTAQVLPAYEQQKRHKKRNKRKGRKNRWFFRGVWLVVLVMFGVGVARFAMVCLNDLLAFHKPSNTVLVELEEDASTEEIADALMAQDVIRNKWAFCMYSKFTNSDGDYEAGTFQLTTDMDYEVLINTLQAVSSTVEIVTVTFREGLQATEMGALLEESGVCTQAEFEDAVNDQELFANYEFVSAIENGSERAYFLEGYLFPDTYDFYVGEGATNSIQKLLANTNVKLTDDLYERAKELGMTMDEVITMASMIQAEAANEADMRVISSVFHNRLNAGDASAYRYLNSDPTIWYPYLTQDEMPSGYAGAYNTYTHAGLPLGPICNPGMAAIEAALEPDDTGYYYFCHSKDGIPYYAATEAEHEQNLAAAGLS